MSVTVDDLSLPLSRCPSPLCFPPRRLRALSSLPDLAHLVTIASSIIHDRQNYTLRTERLAHAIRRTQTNDGGKKSAKLPPKRNNDMYERQLDRNRFGGHERPSRTTVRIRSLGRPAAAAAAGRPPSLSVMQPEGPFRRGIADRKTRSL